MPNNDLVSAIPAGRVFFPAGLRNFSEQKDANPAEERAGRSGIVLLGLGCVGEDVLSAFFEKINRFQKTPLPAVVRAISILAEDESDRIGYHEHIERFFVGRGDGGGRIQMNTDRRRIVLDNIHKYVRDLFFDLRSRYGVGSDIRCFLIAGVSEPEIGIAHPLLEMLGRHHASFADRAAFLFFNTPHTPVLDQQNQYAALRELHRYLLTGIHDGENRLSDKLIERLYFLEGSRRGEEYYSRHIAATTETLFAIIEGGTMLRQFESLTQTSDGNHRIRTLGVRRLAVPFTQLRDYFSSRIVREMWAQSRALLPATVPADSDINAKFRAFHVDKEYAHYLNLWLGAELARWLINQALPVPNVNDPEMAAAFTQRILDFLSNSRLPDRFEIALAGLWFVEGRAAGFSALREACAKLRGGLDAFFINIPKYREYLDQIAKKDMNALHDTTQAPISRWNVRNIDARAEQIFERVFDKTQKDRLLEMVSARSGLSVKHSDVFAFSPVFIPAGTGSDVLLSDHVWRGHEEYFMALKRFVGGFIFSMLIESAEGIQEPDQSALQYLGEAGVPLSNLQNPPLTDNNRGFLLASSERDVETILRRAFTFTASAVHIPRGDNQSLTALTIFTGLRMESFKHVLQCAEVYTPDERLHIDPHLQNAAYFEKQLRKLSGTRARDPFGDNLIMTLLERNAPIAFVKAFITGRLKWEPGKMCWRMAPVKIKNRDFLELEFSSKAANNLTFTAEKESIRSLWLAYARFAVELPYQEVPDGAFHHPLHRNNRADYHKTLIDISKIDPASEEQSARANWLEKQAEERRDQPDLYDFFRLYQAVMKSL